MSHWDADAELIAFSFEGARYVVAALGADVTAAHGAPSLTAAEGAIVALVRRGQSTMEIARARRSSPRTVEHQIETIFRKLQVSSRSELIRELGRRRQARASAISSPGCLGTE
jgi:DNA-binding CsgD family transcriptional regulator